MLKRMAIVSVVVALVTPLSACTAVRALYQSNATLLAGLASKATGPPCAAVASSLQTSELPPICEGLKACVPAFCSVAK